MDYKIIILSSPRSGNTWLRYITEFFTGFSSKGYNEKIRIERSLINNNNDYKILKLHETFSYKIREEQKLLLILRDYKECLTRNLGVKKMKKTEIITDTNNMGSLRNFLNNIKFFDEFKGSKKLIYYCDLIETPETEITAIGNFLNGTEEQINDFLKNYENHQKKCINLYGTLQKSQTNGKTTKYHSKKLDNNLKNILTNLLKKWDTSLYEKYLKRYERN